MVDRIRQLIQARQLSSTQFADTIGVARPVVSHILSGRNKPSLEVVQKILAAFPELSMAWLLNGQGAMLATEPVSAPQSAAKPSNAGAAALPTKRAAKPATEPVMAPNAEATSAVAEPAAETSTAPLPVTFAEAVGLVQPPAPAAPATAAVAARPVTNVEMAPQAVTQTPVTQPKSIRRVLIFYSDGTFTDYTPATEPA